MKKIFTVIGIFIFAAIVYLFVSGGFSHRPAIDYNEKLVRLHDQVTVKMLAFIEATKIENPDHMREKLKELQLQIEESLNAVSALEPFEGDVKLLNAHIKLLKFYKSIASDAYPSMVEIISKPESDITAEDAHLLEEAESEITRQELEITNELKTAQQEFAKRHGFKLKENKYQEKIDNL